MKNKSSWMSICLRTYRLIHASRIIQSSKTKHVFIIVVDCCYTATFIYQNYVTRVTYQFKKLIRSAFVKFVHKYSDIRKFFYSISALGVIQRNISRCSNNSSEAARPETARPSVEHEICARCTCGCSEEGGRVSALPFIHRSESEHIYNNIHNGVVFCFFCFFYSQVWCRREPSYV